MSYIGRGIDSIDNISTLDNLSFNGSDATFNLTQNSVAFVPVSADALQIQIDGVIQSGNYTVSGSTVTFDFTPSGSSVCNGIRHFGVGLLTQPSDGSVNMAQLGASGTKDATTFLRGDNTFATVSSTTINNNADNRVITGSGTANTLEGEANLNFNSTNLMVGTNATTGTADGLNDLIVGNTSSGSHGISIQTPNNQTGYLAFADDSTSPNPCFISYDHANGYQRFWVNGAERMRIDSSGNILMGKTSTSFNADGGMITEGGQQIKLTRDGDEVCFASNFINTSGYPMAFHYSGSTVGTIRSTNNSTSYNTSSDYRLKENEVAISDGITRLKNLKPYRFNFKNDKDKTVDGFFAHEVSSVVPEAISGTKDAMHPEVLYTADDELPEGKEIGDVKEATKINPQSIDQSKLVPLLTSALQEAITKIETLEARVQTLENA